MKETITYLTDERTQAEALEIMTSVSTLYFTTIDSEGFPSTRAMLNLRNPRLYPQFAEEYAGETNPLTVYLSTNTSSEKFSQITACDKASLYFCKPQQFRGVMLRGRIGIISEMEFKRRIWRPKWKMYYPGGVGSDDFTMLRFVPDSVKIYSNFSVRKSQI